MVKFILQVSLLTLLAMALAKHSSEEELCVLYCDDDCVDPPTSCEDINGVKGQLLDYDCNCCPTCVYPASKYIANYKILKSSV